MDRSADCEHNTKDFVCRPECGGCDGKSKYTPSSKTVRIAHSIFTQLDSPNYTDEQKALAIRIVLDMPTHMSITKDQIIVAAKWLFDRCFEIEESEEANE